MNSSSPNKKLDTYLDLCTQVYELSKPSAPSDTLSFYLEFAKSVKGPILEPMCGSGRFLIPLIEQGLDIHGFDASEHMLNVLFHKAKTKKLHPNVWESFVQDLERPERYNLIFIPSGSFCLITDLKEVKVALEKIYHHLNDDGIFVFEAETIYAVPSQGVWRGSVWTKPNGQKIMLSQLASMHENICHSIGKYELVEDNQIIHTEIEELKVRIYNQAHLIELLKSVGFRQVRMIKAFDYSKSPSNKDESIVYECRK